MSIYDSKRSFRIVAPSFADSCANKLLLQQKRVEELLEAEGFVLAPDPLTDFATNSLEVSEGGASSGIANCVRRLAQEPIALGRSLAARFGLIYIQDRSSMLPPLALNPALGSLVLDMCASPGSKTGQLAQMIGSQGLVVANEPSKNRLPVLRANLGHLNLWHTVTTSYKGEAYPAQAALFEQIQLDPPCSGWGTVVRNPKVMDMWAGDKTKPLVHLQRSLLREATRLLAAGGRMVYSTCTTNVEENEDQLLWAQEYLGLKLVALPALPAFKLADPARDNCDGVWRVNNASLADDGSQGLEEVQGQGFFVACLQKDSSPNTSDSNIGVDLDLKALENSLVNPFENAERFSPDFLAAFGYDAKKAIACELAVLGRDVHCVPNKAVELLGSAFEWRGLSVGKYANPGKYANAGMKPLSSLRSLMPDLEASQKVGQALVVENVADVHKLLSGLSLEAAESDANSKHMFLYYKDLPLCRLMKKGKRLLFSD